MKINISEKILQCIHNKVKKYDDPKHMGGLFSFSEVIVLVHHFNAKPIGRCHTYEYCLEHLKRGESDSTWFYFHTLPVFNKFDTRHHNKG